MWITCNRGSATTARVLRKVCKSTPYLARNRDCSRGAAVPEMGRARSIHVSAPSSSLLLFLRSQSEEVCYFTPNHNLNLSRRPRSRLLRNAPYQSHIDRFPSSTRRFSTSHRRSAAVEPPILSTEFSRIAPRNDNLYQYPPATACRTGILGPYVSQDSPTTRRYASTDSRPLLKRLWPLKRQKPDSALKPNDLPPLPSFLDDAAGTTLGRSKGKAANELKLRCTEINEKGEVTLVNGEFKKSELIAKVRPEGQIYTCKGTDELGSMAFSPATFEKSIPPYCLTSSSDLPQS